MYIVDTSSFLVLGHYYPDNFPTVWTHINQLVKDGKFASVKEAKRELELNFHTEHLELWVKNNSRVFSTPSIDEMMIVSDIFTNSTFQALIKRSNLLKGLPVADPFIVAAAKHKNAHVLTEEKYKKNAARIPNVCEKLEVPCINMQTFLIQEKIIL
jgi:hypothetical protein